MASASLNDVNDTSEHGYGRGYQESVEIESKCLFGMEADEFYRRQVGLVLDEIPGSLFGDSSDLTPRKFSPKYNLPKRNKLKKKASRAGMKLVDNFDLGLDSEKRVLDLAVGEGDTSRYLATSGVRVEARDIEPYLVERGKERDSEVRESSDEVGGVRDGIRESANNVSGSINYAEGDYAQIKESVDKDDQFDAITCLSRSFIYLGERENYVKALKDFHSLLVPGGKVVLQSRAQLKEGKLPWSSEMGTSFSHLPGGPACITDEKSGTKVVWKTDQVATDLSDGVKQSTCSRHLEYRDGTVKDLGQIVADDHLDFSNLEGMGGILKEAGFANLQLKVENLSIDGTEIMFAIVAEKLEDPTVSGPRKKIKDRARKLLGL